MLRRAHESCGTLGFYVWREPGKGHTLSNEGAVSIPRRSLNHDNFSLLSRHTKRMLQTIGATNCFGCFRLLSTTLFKSQLDIVSQARCMWAAVDCVSHRGDGTQLIVENSRSLKSRILPQLVVASSKSKFRRNMPPNATDCTSDNFTDFSAPVLMWTTIATAKSAPATSVFTCKPRMCR